MTLRAGGGDEEDRAGLGLCNEGQRSAGGILTEDAWAGREVGRGFMVEGARFCGSGIVGRVFARVAVEILSIGRSW